MACQINLSPLEINLSPLGSPLVLPLCPLFVRLHQAVHHEETTGRSPLICRWCNPKEKQQPAKYASLVYILLLINPNIAPASRKLAQDRCGWTPLWRASHSRCYDLREEPVRACLNKPGPGQDSGRLKTVMERVTRILAYFASLTCVYRSPRIRLVQYSG